MLWHLGAHGNGAGRAHQNPTVFRPFLI